MSFANEASKLLTNKYFLYFMVFLAATNVLGYLVTNKLNAVAFFALTGFLTYQFSKNMAVILLVALIATNFMMSSKFMREGLENKSDSTDLDKVESKDPEIANAMPAVKKAKTNEEAKTELKSDTTTTTTSVTDVNNTDLNKPSDEAGAPEGVGEKMGSKKTKSENFGPRLDYAATIEQSYQNLDTILGSDSIKQLSTDTQKLMQQQQNLFNTMNQMVPVLEGAKDLLSGFNMKDLEKSFKSIGGLGGAPTIVGQN
jgi:uncharacterized membrane protein YciS (DUF1049 family)